MTAVLEVNRNNMDFTHIEEAERQWQEKQNEFLKLAKEICSFKKKTNDLEIENVANERELNNTKQAMIEKKILLEVIKTQVAFVEETCRQKVEEEQAVVAETQKRKVRLWEKYKQLVKMADEEEIKVRMKYAGKLKQSSYDYRKQREAADDILMAEIEVMKQFLAFQERKKKELLEIISRYETV